MKKILSFSLLLLAPVLVAASPLEQSQLAQLKALDVLQLQMPAQKTSTTSTKPGVGNQPRPILIARTVPVSQSLEQLTEWQRIDTQAVMRLQLEADKAKHLNLGFEQVKLPDSAVLYILDSETGSKLESFTASNIVNQQLWTPQLVSSSVIIELQVDAMDQAQTSLVLRQVGLGEKDFSADSWLKSGSCNVDIVCPTGDNWRDVSRSVSRYIISDANGTYGCTGSLVNNDRYDQRPLLLTAAHCLVSESTAASMVFYWNYETSTCGGTPDGRLNQATSGATFIARGEGVDDRSDFALVELTETPPFMFNVFYSGWNAVDQGAANVVTIHHPQNDEKRISVDVDPLLITAFDSDVADTFAQYYRIGDWEEGTTEGGSSGAGIWNQNKEIIGTLSGGDASCAALDAPDWYGRMADHWDSAGTHPLVSSFATLSPVNNERQLSGMDSCEGASISIEADNITPAVNETISLSATLSGGTEPFNYAWDFDNDGTTDANEINPGQAFNAPGLYDVYLMVDDANACRTSAKLTIRVADATESFLANGQLPDSFIIPDSTDAGWVVTDDTSSEGTYSLRAQIINEFETATIDTSETFQAGTISFSYKTSTEENFDSLRFYIGTNNLLTADGETDWTQVSFPIAAGQHRLRWEYQKDASGSGGVDTVWIDNFRFTPTVTENPSPPAASNSGGGSMPWQMVFILFLLSLVRPSRERLRKWIETN